MSAVDLISELRGAGAVVEARGERLHIEAPRGLITPEKRELLRARKAELLAWLKTQRNRRAIVAFSLAEHPEHWPVCIGAPGETADDVITGLRRRYGPRLVNAKPQRSA